MEFRLLGPFETADGERSLALGGRTQRSLTAILLVHAIEVVSSDRLIAELWGERPPATASKSVHNDVSRLRRELGDRRLTTWAPGYVLHVNPSEFDVAMPNSLLCFVAGRRSRAISARTGVQSGVQN